MRRATLVAGLVLLGALTAVVSAPQQETWTTPPPGVSRGATSGPADDAPRAGFDLVLPRPAPAPATPPPLAAEPPREAAPPRQDEPPAAPPPEAPPTRAPDPRGGAPPAPVSTAGGHEEEARAAPPPPEAESPAAPEEGAPSPEPPPSASPTPPEAPAEDAPPSPADPPRERGLADLLRDLFGAPEPARTRALLDLPLEAASRDAPCGFLCLGLELRALLRLDG